MRGFKNWFVGVFMGGALGAGLAVLFRNGLPPDPRRKLKHEFDNAMEAGRRASAARRIELEKRLDELIGPETPK